MASLQVTWDEEGNGRPRIALCSSAAKSLQFFGASPAWLVKDDSEASEGSGWCAAPPAVNTDLWSDAKTLKLEGKQWLFVPCQELWTIYVSDAALVDEGDTDEEENEDNEAWKVTHKEFVDKLKMQSQATVEHSEDKKKIKEVIKKKLATKMKRKEEELNRKRVIGGFSVGQTVRSTADVLVRGQVVVSRNAIGTIQGPAIKNPLTRINVFFKGRLDGKFRSVNVLPREIDLHTD